MMSSMKIFALCAVSASAIRMDGPESHVTLVQETPTEPFLGEAAEAEKLTFADLKEMDRSDRKTILKKATIKNPVVLMHPVHNAIAIFDATKSIAPGSKTKYTVAFLNVFGKQQGAEWMTIDEIFDETPIARRQTSSTRVSSSSTSSWTPSPDRERFQAQAIRDQGRMMQNSFYY